MHDSNSIIYEKSEDEAAKNPLYRIIVIGASAGGFEALKKVIGGLPPDIHAAIFIVWHMSSDVRGILPHVLNNVNNISAAHAYDGEEITPNRIYVASPDHHLLIEEGKIRITKGPKENRFRPAIDPLFRSAAYAFGSRVIGVILSGALDDGTAGLWQVKNSGGIAVVQDPADAEVPSMPQSALREVSVDYCIPVSEMAGLLARLSTENFPENAHVMKNEKMKIEIDIAAEDRALERGSMTIGDLSPFACPECHGVLSRIMDGKFSRYRCHTGHAYSPDTLLAALTEKIEDSLYNAIRGMDECIILLNHMGDHLAEANEIRLAAVYFNKAKQASERSNLIRQAIMTNEPLTKSKLRQEAEENDTQQV